MTDAMSWRNTDPRVDASLGSIPMLNVGGGASGDGAGLGKLLLDMLLIGV